MRKTAILLTLLLYIPCAVWAQKVKVKRGEVLLDKKPVATLQDVGNTYTFADINNKENPVFKVKFNYLKLSEETSKSWLTVSYPDDRKSTEIDMEYLSFTMNNKKGVAELLTKKYNILTPSGIDKAALDAFMAVERPNLTNTYNELLKGEITKERTIANIDVSVDADYRRIFKGAVPYTSSATDNRLRASGQYENLLGSYAVDQGKRTINIYDLDNKKVALASVSMFDDVTVTLPYTKQDFTYKSKKRFEENKYSQQDFIRELVGNLYLRGVTLGHQIRDEKARELSAQREIAKESYEIAKENSVNIYGQPGYVIDKKGQRYDGKITMVWEDIPNPAASGVTAEDLSDANIRKRVKILSKNKKGKARYYTFSSKKEEKFCVVNEDQTTTCFIGMRVKGKGLELAAGAVGALSFDTSQYYKILKEEKNNLIVQDMLTGAIIIKIDTQAKGYQFNTNNTDKNSGKLSEYLGCNIPEDMINMDYSRPESAQQVLDFYNSTCNK